MSYHRGRPEENPVVSTALTKVTVLLDSKKDPNGKALVETAEELGRYLARDARMSSAQIRNLFTEVRKLDFNNNGPYKLNILRAKLAYTAGRHREVKDLQRILDLALQEVGTDGEKYLRFADFFEAIVAYHKKHGGKE